MRSTSIRCRRSVRSAPRAAISNASRRRRRCSAARSRALGQLGQGAEAVGNAGFDVLRQRQERTNEIGTSETNTWLAKAFTDRLNDFQRLQGRAAQDALPKYKQD